MNTHNQDFTFSPRTQAGSSQLIIIVVVAILVLAGIGYALFFRAPDDVMKPSVPVPPAAKQARPDNARDIINQLKETSDVDYEVAYRQAGEFMSDGDMADAQLLYFFAAREGHGPSAMVLAGLYDPVGFDADRSLMDQPDVFQAFKWYKKALEAGEEQAAEPLAALKSWCEQAAAEGDEKAAQVLLQWEQ